MTTAYWDKASYDILMEINPALVDTLRLAIEQGASAADVERKLSKRFGQGSVMVNAATGAAHFIESEVKNARQ